MLPRWDLVVGRVRAHFERMAERTATEPRLGGAEAIGFVIGIAAADGWRALHAFDGDHIRATTRLVSVLVTAALVAAAATVGLLGGRVGFAALRVALGPPRRTPAAAARAIALAIGVAFTAVRASMWIRASLTQTVPSRAAPLAVLATLGAIGAAALFARAIERRAAGTAWLSERALRGRLLVRFEHHVVFGVALLGARDLLPGDGSPYVPALGLGLVGMIAASLATPRPSARFTRAAWTAAAAALTLGVVATVALPRLSGRARMSVYYRTALAGTIASSVTLSSARARAEETPWRDGLGAAAGTTTAGTATATARTAPPPDIVVLHLDALRADFVGPQAGAESLTPALDRLADTSLRFSHAYSVAPSTRQSMGGIFTGFVGRDLPIDRADARQVLRSDATTLAAALQSDGYDTLGVTFPYVKTYMPGFERGFRVWRSAWEGEPPRAGLDRRTTESVLEELARHDAAPHVTPLFLYAHYMCAHAPYVDGRSGDVRTRYAATVALCDAAVGPLLDALARRPRARETVVVALADHGEMLGEHGLWFHGPVLYDELLHVPLIVHLPSAAARALAANVSLGEVGPALLRLAGIGGPPARPGALDDVLFRGGVVRAVYPVLFATEEHVGLVPVDTEAILCGRTKFVRDQTTGAEQLFQLDDDPDERRNVRRRFPAAWQALGAALDDWHAGKTPTCPEWTARGGRNRVPCTTERDR